MSDYELKEHVYVGAKEDKEFDEFVEFVADKANLTQDAIAELMARDLNVTLNELRGAADKLTNRLKAMLGFPPELYTELAKDTGLGEKDIKWVIWDGATKGKSPEEFFEWVAMMSLKSKEEVMQKYSSKMGISP